MASGPEECFETSRLSELYVKPMFSVWDIFVRSRRSQSTSWCSV